MTTTKLNPNTLYQAGTAPDTIPSQTDMVARDAAAVAAATAAAAAAAPALAPVQKVAGRTGDITLSPTDVSGLVDTSGSTLQSFTVKNQGTSGSAQPLFNIVGALNESTVLTRHWNSGDGSDFFPAYRRAIANRVAAWGGKIITPGSRQQFGVSNIVYLTPDNTLNTTANGIHVEIDAGVTVQQTLTATVGGVAYGYAPLFVINGNDCAVRGKGATLQSLGTAPGSVSGLPSFQIYQGINPHAAVYHAAGDRYVVEDLNIDGFQSGISICGNVANLNISNPAQQILAVNGQVRRIRLTNYGFGVLHQLNDGLIMDTVIGEGSQELSGDLNPPHLIYGTNRGCRASQNLLVTACREVDNSYASGIKARNWINSVIMGNRLGGLPNPSLTAVGQDRGIQVEWSSGVVVTGNALTISPTGDGAPAGILFVDCLRCSEHGNWSTQTGNAAGVTITRDETNTITFLAGTAQTGAANQATIGVVNGNYAISANALVTPPTTSQSISTGCILSIVGGTGAGQSQAITANPATAAGAAMGNVTVAANWSPVPDVTSVFHLQDPRCGQNVIGQGTTIVGTQTTGQPGQAAISISNSDGNYVKGPFYGNTGNDTVAFPFHVQHTMGTVIDDPALVNPNPGPLNATKCVQVTNTSINTTILYHPARWPGATFSDSGIGTQIINLSQATANLIGVATNITPATNSTYNIGSSTLQWNAVYSEEFDTYGTNSDSSVYQTKLSPNILQFGAAATSYVKLQATGVLAVQFNSVTAYQFSPTTLTFGADATITIGSSSVAASNMFSHQFTVPGVNGDTTTYTTSLQPTLLTFGGTSTAFVKSVAGTAFQVNGTTIFSALSSSLRMASGMILTAGSANSTVIDGSGFHRNVTVTGLSSAGTGQSTATALTGQMHQLISSTNAGGAGFVLPAGATGLTITVINADATNAALIYPASGASIGTAAANVAYSLAAGTSVVFKAISATKWYT